MIKYFGINRAIGFALVKRLWSVMASPITILLIASSLTKVEQGYYFTFASLLALQVFFEMGLATVISQFISHEFASLSWGQRGEIVGIEDNKNRVLNILGNSLKWYSVCSVLLIILLSLTGFIFFRDEANYGVSWGLPWLLAVLGVSINLLIVPFYAVISGSGDVASVNFRSLIGGILGSLLGWGVLFLGGGLYAIPAVTFGNIIIAIIYLSKIKPLLIVEGINFALNKVALKNPVSWRDEIWPMQWKIAVSWISGYFIFQLFVPVLFKFHGPVVAGQMGMTLSVVNALQVICLIWPNSRMPEYGKFIAKNNWTDLDNLFRKTLKQSLEVCSLTIIAFLILILVLKNFSNLGDRFLPTWQIVLLLLSMIGQLLVTNWAMYMRAHKQEPMMSLSFIGALLTGFSTLIFGYYFSSLGMILGFVLITFLYAIPTTYKLFKKFKLSNHY